VEVGVPSPEPIGEGVSLPQPARRASTTASQTARWLVRGITWVW